MSKEFEEFNKFMMREMKSACSKKAFDHMTNPRNVGGFEDATGYGSASEQGGDSLEIWLRIEDGTVAKIGFFVKGCTTLIAAGSALTEMVKGKTAQEAQEVTPEGLIKYLGRLPTKTEHCADMAVDALREAVMSHLVSELTKNFRGEKGFRTFRLEL